MVFTLRDTTKAISDELHKSYSRNPNMALLTVKTGGGKTYGAIHTFGEMMPDATLLVFTTSKVARSKQWEASVKDYNQVMGTKLKVICYNYDKLVIQRFLDKLATQLQAVANHPIVLVLDEVHRIKLAGNGKLSKRSKILMQLAKQPYISTTLGLSATAFSNSYLDVAPYLIMAGYYSSKSDFMKKHIKRFDDYFNPVIKDRFGNISREAFRNPDQIDNELNSISVFIDTSKYTPELTRHHVTFDLSPDEQLKYNQIMQDFRDGLSYEFPIQARMAQEKYLANQGAWHKDLFLLSLLKRREVGEFGKKAPVLVFYEYTAVYEHLRKLLKIAYPDYDIVAINGSANLTTDDLGKPDNDNSIYLIQYQSGGEGLDWQWSNLSIFYESPVRYEKFVQAKGRNLRNKSQTPHVYHYELEYNHTLDGLRWETNRSKRDFTDEVSEKVFYQELNEMKG